ncbi:unnamed protein product [Penicillium salamii]|nr:unnamed protein product [Penicillium salamii]CAG8357836.1 unnamed protein product [Penicillium salamii]
MDEKDIMRSHGPPSLDQLTCTFHSKCRPVNPTGETAKELRKRLEEVYMSGRPLFTKKNIRYAWAQTKRTPGNGGKLYSKDFSGNTIEHDVTIGRSHDWDHHLCGGCQEHQRYAMWSNFSLFYMSKDTLKANLKQKNDDALLSPVSILHRGYLADAKTNHALPPVPTIEFERVDMVNRIKNYEWKGSLAYRKLKAILSASAQTHDIKKTISFALGCFSSTALPYCEAKRSMAQHALLRTIKEWLQKKNGGKSPCYAQDPSYNSIDKRILGDSGIQVIDDPCGWLEVDEQSMVVSIGASLPVKEIIADIARPAVIIWEQVGVTEAIGLVGKSDSADPDSLRVVQMMQDYEMHEFGAGEELSAWGSLVLYVRKSKTAPNFR